LSRSTPRQAQCEQCSGDDGFVAGDDLFHVHFDSPKLKCVCCCC
jgi:hypothetical protein